MSGWATSTALRAKRALTCSTSMCGAEPEGGEAGGECSHAGSPECPAADRVEEFESHRRGREPGVRAVPTNPVGDVLVGADVHNASDPRLVEPPPVQRQNGAEGARFSALRCRLEPRPQPVGQR